MPRHIQADVTAERWKSRCAANRWRWVTVIAKIAGAIPPTPVSAFTLWKPDQVKITKGEEFLGKFKSSEISDRRYCTKCGGHVMVDHPTLGLVDVRVGALRNFPFKPKVHLNYEETVLPMRDGLPKLKDFPAEIGGSGESIPE